MQTIFLVLAPLLPSLPHSPSLQLASLLTTCWLPALAAVERGHLHLHGGREQNNSGYAHVEEARKVG